MTAPIQEPTQGRQDAGQDWRTRQLFRRPAIVNPGSVGGGSVYPMGPFNLTWLASRWDAQDQFGWSLIDATATNRFGSWAFEATVDTRYFIGGFVLGPYGSRWGMAFDCERGPDCGIIAVDFATGSQNADNEGFTVPEGKLDSPYNSSGGTYSQFVNKFTHDLYNAAPGFSNFGSASSAIDFCINGADGDTLTAFTQWDPDLGPGVASADGGAGVWWVRVRVAGQNPSSSGFRVTIRNAWLVRMTWDAFLT